MQVFVLHNRLKLALSVHMQEIATYVHRSYVRL